jgi:hypothetical protein
MGERRRAGHVSLKATGVLAVMAIQSGYNLFLFRDTWTNKMSQLMGVLLNGIAQLEYDRNRQLPDYQAAYLEKMDVRMDDGIFVGDETIKNPDTGQRAQFVAANLADAIKNNDEQKAAAMCTWLADRMPDLKQVKIVEAGDEISIDLVFDEEYVKQTAVAFPKLS